MEPSNLPTESSIYCAIIEHNLLSTTFLKQLRAQAQFNISRSCMSDPMHFCLTQCKTGEQGTYTCIAKNAGGESRSQIDLQVYTKPRVSKEHGKQGFRQGAAIVLQCYADATPEPKFSWLHNAAPLPSDDQRISINTKNGSVLIITNARESDAGIYTCFASNQFGCATTLLDAVFVSEPRIEDIDAPKRKLSEGETISIRCLASGRPRPTISWEHNGKPAVGIPEIRTDQYLGTSEFYPVKMKWNGIWTCVAENAGGKANRSVELTITSEEMRPSER
ncbi:unnamed protein product [Calicophoron daubneyi]|uniref:Ig-like domain-containing protein n=1 Tax=Calicophoron daubneyi TaxID=300641 RepID=A0AAV2SZ16_CALDB